MSLLDDVSIVVTPNGYKAGELYAVIPSNGDADMDVTRTTDATRVDENGLIADVLSGVPRIDYTGGGCPHILAEPQRTNLFPYSEDFSQWQKNSNITLSLNSTTAPDGSVSADNISYVGSIGTPNDKTLQKQISVSTSNKDFTNSVYIKGTGEFRIKNTHGGVVDNFSSDFTATSNWVRYDFSVSNSSSAGNGSQIAGILASSTNSAFNLDVWGGQLEEGSYATSYIPTSGSTVTRNQDIFTRDGIGSLINSTEGTLVIEPRYFINDGSTRKISISDGTGTNRIYITPYQGLASRIRYIFTSGGATQADLQVTGIDITISRKLAFVWKTNRFELWQNGSKISEDTSGTTPSAGIFNQIHFGSETGNGTTLFEGELKQLQVYNTALTDTQLAALTS